MQDWIAGLLERYWPTLPNELGEQWEGFLTKFSDIMGSLPPNPSQDAFEVAAASLENLERLLRLYPYTRGLLDGYRCGAEGELDPRVSFVQPSAAASMGDVEQVANVAQRSLRQRQTADETLRFLNKLRSMAAMADGASRRSDTD